MGAGTMNLLQARGAQSPTPSRYKPVWTDRFWQGYYSNRNLFRSPLSAFYTEGWGLGKTDALCDPSLNVELSPRLTICRRPGWLSYSTASLPSVATGFYSFLPLTFGSSYQLIVDTASSVCNLTTSAVSTIYTKQPSAGNCRFLGLGNVLYMADGVSSQAWQPGVSSPNPRNWGISIGPFSGLTGPTNPTVGTDIPLLGPAWTNPTDAANGGANYASVNLTLPGNVANYTDYVSTTGYSLGVASTATVNGIIVTVSGYQANASSNASLYAQLVINGYPVGVAKSFQLPTTAGTVTLGSSGDLWGTTLSPAIINSSSFGVAINGSCNPRLICNQTWYVNNVQISFYAAGQLPVSPTGTGSCSATTGYMYVVAYGNSNSGHVSTSTPQSSSTGAYTGKEGVQISLTASSDPQVNQIWIFRTTDGGSDFYNIPGSPLSNTTQNYIDTSASSDNDSQLNILLPAPQAEANNPPPSGTTIPAYWMGRVWVAVGNYLYASGGPDTITGNGAEAFPPANYWITPSPIMRMVPTANGLVLFLADRVQMISGGPAITQFYLQPLTDGIGLLNYDALTTFGSTAYLFSSDKQLISYDMSSGVSEPGFPIENKLVSLNPSTASVTHHTHGLDRGLFVCDGNSTWYKCWMSPVPDGSYTGPVWSPPGTIATGSVSLMKSVETGPGVKQLLCASGTQVGYRDSDFLTFSDFGTAYDAYATFGSIVLAYPGQLAELGFITADFTRVGTSPGVAYLLGEASGTFSTMPLVVSDPPKIYGISGAPTSLYSNRYYFRQSASGGGSPAPVWARHLQIQVNMGTDTVQNEILTQTLWGSILEGQGPVGA